MTTAIVVIWAVGLLVALPVTLVIVKESLLLIYTLQDTLRMARVTAAAARSLEANVAAVPAVAGVAEALRPIDAKLAEVAASAEQLASRFTAVLR